MLASKETTLIAIFHPELSYIFKLSDEHYYMNLLSNYFFSLHELSGVETYQTAVMLFPQLVALIFLVFMFACIYFSYFTHMSKEGLMVDADYLVSNSSAEAEKEITSFDDMILGLVILAYIFG